MNRMRFWFLPCALLTATTLFAQLSPAYEQWGETAVHYLMTKQEQTDWAAVKTDADAKAFIDLFWARRDPTPDTAPNELRQQIEARTAEADKRYGSGKTQGSQSDEGVVYTLLGDPTQIAVRVRKTLPTESTSTQFDRPINIQTWMYRGDAAARATGQKSFDIAFVFLDEKHPTEFELDGQSRLAFESTALTIAKSVLKRPFLTAADLTQKADPNRTVALGLIVVGDDTLAKDILRRALEHEDFAELARRYSTHHSAQQGGYLGKIAFAELDPDFKTALAGKPPGTAVLISRPPLFAVVKLLTDAETPK